MSFPPAPFSLGQLVSGQGDSAASVYFDSNGVRCVERLAIPVVWLVFSTLLTLFWFGCWVTRPRSPPSAEDEKVVFVTKFGKSALENTSINVEPSNLVFYKGNSTGLRSTRHFEYFVVFLVHRLWQSSTMSFAARTSPAHTTPETITAAPAVISAAPSVTVAAPAPALSYSSSLPTISAAPAPVTLAAPVASVAPRVTSTVPAPVASYTTGCTCSMVSKLVSERLLGRGALCVAGSSHIRNEIV